MTVTGHRTFLIRYGNTVDEQSVVMWDNEVRLYDVWRSTFERFYRDCPHDMIIWIPPLTSFSAPLQQQDNVHVNMESVQCVSIAFSEVRITEISELLTRVDQTG